MPYKRKRGSSQQLQVYKGKNPITGKKEYYYETFRGTDYQADKRLAAIQTDMDRSEFIEPSKLTFYQFLKEEFLPHIKSDKSLGTWEEYNGIVENHIKNDPLGKMIITKITNREATGYKLRMLETPCLKRKNRTLSPKTVKNHIIMLKAAFNYACELGMFNHNPLKYLRFPEVPDFTPVVFNEEDAHNFINAAESLVLLAKGNPEKYYTAFKFYLYFLLAIYTGMRQGELRGLRWTDINTQTGLISVTQQVRKEGDHAIYKKPKTRASKTSVSFDLNFIPLFDEHKKGQLWDMQKCKDLQKEYKANHLVFAAYNGNPLGWKVIKRNFDCICDAAKVPRIRRHDLRHSCATLLLAEGVPLKVVQERLRHASIKITADIYSHVLPKMQQDANEKMNQVLKFKTRLN